MHIDNLRYDGSRRAFAADVRCIDPKGFLKVPVRVSAPPGIEFERLARFLADLARRTAQAA